MAPNDQPDNQPDHLLAEFTREFRFYKNLADRALAQVDDTAFFAALDDGETNSIAVNVKHMGGNLRSRWRDFLTTDGEKPDRHRDSEFELGPEDSREALQALWERGWGTLFDTLAGLSPGDLGNTVQIRAEPHTVSRALLRSLAHASYHAGQIALLARHWKGAGWQTLSVPRGKSEEHNKATRERWAAGSA
ncbi:MAG TPA: DUF1572 family protein [Thermoanaerobaculia bacterium]|nr:DUF1572 family protein [Thermoanaerobaculia bacterium]